MVGGNLFEITVYRVHLAFGGEKAGELEMDLVRVLVDSSFGEPHLMCCPGEAFSASPTVTGVCGEARCVATHRAARSCPSFSARPEGTAGLDRASRELKTADNLLHCAPASAADPGYRSGQPDMSNSMEDVFFNPNHRGFGT